VNFEADHNSNHFITVQRIPRAVDSDISESGNLAMGLINEQRIDRTSNIADPEREVQKIG
jgi:hypothetical protein